MGSRNGTDMETQTINIQAVRLKEGEKVIRVIRRHWFHIALRAVADLFLFLLIALAITLFDAYLIETQGGEVLQRGFALGLYMLAFIGLFLWMHFFALWSDHWLDAWIITNKRIIDIEQHGFFRRQVSSFPLDRIQDVTYGINGIIAMWLKFGNIRIQTASISDDLIMKQVPFPETVKETIVQVIDETKHD